MVVVLVVVVVVLVDVVVKEIDSIGTKGVCVCTKSTYHFNYVKWCWCWNTIVRVEEFQLLLPNCSTWCSFC